jgi:hypothetical protein
MLHMLMKTQKNATVESNLQTVIPSLNSLFIPFCCFFLKKQLIVDSRVYCRRSCFRMVPAEDLNCFTTTMRVESTSIYPQLTLHNTEYLTSHQLTMKTLLN